MASNAHQVAELACPAA